MRPAWLRVRRRRCLGPVATPLRFGARVPFGMPQDVKRSDARVEQKRRVEAPFGRSAPFGRVCLSGPLRVRARPEAAMCMFRPTRPIQQQSTATSSSYTTSITTPWMLVYGATTLRVLLDLARIVGAYGGKLGYRTAAVPQGARGGVTARRRAPRLPGGLDLERDAGRRERGWSAAESSLFRVRYIASTPHDEHGPGKFHRAWADRSPYGPVPRPHVPRLCRWRLACRMNVCECYPTHDLRGRLGAASRGMPLAQRRL